MTTDREAGGYYSPSFFILLCERDKWRRSARRPKEPLLHFSTRKRTERAETRHSAKKALCYQNPQRKARTPAAVEIRKRSQDQSAQTVETVEKDHSFYFFRFLFFHSRFTFFLFAILCLLRLLFIHTMALVLSVCVKCFYLTGRLADVIIIT